MSLRFNNYHRCGASIITANRALTAAHCYRPISDDLRNLTVMAGSTSRFGDGGSYIIGLKKFIQHPDYNNSTLINDIAVLWLQYNLIFGPNIQTVAVNNFNSRI